MEKTELRLFALAFLVVALGGCSRWPRQFSPEDWSRTPTEFREAMARDFIANHYRKGMNVDEVKAMLGTPDDDFNGGLYYFIGDASHGYTVLEVRTHSDGTTFDPKIWKSDPPGHSK